MAKKTATKTALPQQTPVVPDNSVMVRDQDYSKLEELAENIGCTPVMALSRLIIDDYVEFKMMTIEEKMSHLIQEVLEEEEAKKPKKLAKKAEKKGKK